MPCRLEESDQSELDLEGEGESEGEFSEYYDLLQRYAGDERITSILTGKKLSVSASKSAPPFDPALDVNQNKLLGRVLNSDLTLIRAQHAAAGKGGTGTDLVERTEILCQGQQVGRLPQPGGV